MHLYLLPNSKLALIILFLCVKNMAVFVSQTLGGPYLSQMLVFETSIKTQTTDNVWAFQSQWDLPHF